MQKQSANSKKRFIWKSNRNLIATTAAKDVKITDRKETKIAFRLSKKEKQSITAKAKRCGLSTTEYVKQRALGYEPKAVPPDALFLLLERIGELEVKSTSSEVDAKIERLLTDIANILLLHGKDGGALLQLQDSGPFTGT